LGRGEGEGKKSKSKVKNAEGKKPMEWIEENGWEVLNGSNKGRKKGNGLIQVSQKWCPIS
jgi:hypothetical protein